MRVRTVVISAALALAVSIIALESLNLIFTHAVIEHQKGDSACPHDREIRTYQQWLQTTRFPYNAPSERVRQIVDHYGQVKVGSSKKEVIEALGLPDFEHEMIPKEPWRPCVGYDFHYYFEKSDGETENLLKDSRIDIFFTADGKADWITSTVSGLGPKGSCCSSK